MIINPSKRMRMNLFTKINNNNKDNNNNNNKLRYCLLDDANLLFDLLVQHQARHHSRRRLLVEPGQHLVVRGTRAEPVVRHSRDTRDASAARMAVDRRELNQTQLVLANKCKEKK
jgi:hypothetical protein